MKILLGVDGSEVSYEAMRFAFEECKLHKAKLFVVHSLYGEDKTDEEDIKRGRELLEKAEKEARKENLSVDTSLLVRGMKAGPDIASYAEENHIDLIVVGSHGWTGIKRFVLGSVAESVLRRAHCPVVVVKKRT